MPDEAIQAEISAALERINGAWLEGRPADLSPVSHPALTMAFPGFSGRAANVAGFTDFCANANVREFQQDELQIDVMGNTAVASYKYVMI